MVADRPGRAQPSGVRRLGPLLLGRFGPAPGVDRIGPAVGARQHRLEQRHQDRRHRHDDDEEDHPDEQIDDEGAGADGGDGCGGHLHRMTSGDDSDAAPGGRSTQTTTPPPPAPDARGTALDDAEILRARRGRIVVRARRPAALVIPFALFTEVVGLLFVLDGIPIGPYVMAAPVVALLVTAVLFRPSLELTREGLLQRQYPFSSLTRWEAIDHLGLTQAGNRMVLAYRLREGIPPPRRQPAASLLRAAGRPYDGGFFADSMVGRPERILATVDAYLRDPQRRATLPPARR